MDMENQVQQQNEVNVDTQPSVHEEPKMVQMTQEQLDKLISDRLARQERKLNEQFNKRLDEMSEAQKLAQMSEEERKEHDYAKRLEELTNREKALQERENAHAKAKYHEEITSQLKAKGLPTDMADLLVGFDAETVASKIASMEQSFTTQVNSSIEAKVKASASVPTAPTKEAQGLLTLEQIKSMSTKEVQANKELVDRSLEAIWGRK